MSDLIPRSPPITDNICPGSKVVQNRIDQSVLANHLQDAVNQLGCCDVVVERCIRVVSSQTFARAQNGLKCIAPVTSALGGKTDIRPAADEVSV
jgi:hypothetical protein